MNIIDSQRIEWVDISKFICIIFVMLAHLECNTWLLRQFYSPFFLTLFFFVAGYVYNDDRTFKEHLIKKIKGLFIPWFIFSNVNILLSAIISLHGERDTLSELFWNALQIRGKGDGIWFVAALFVAFIPFYYAVKIKKPRIILLVSMILSICSMLYNSLMNPNVFPWMNSNLPWHIEYVFQAMLWMILGYYFKLYGEKLFDKYVHTIAIWIITWITYLAIVYLLPEKSGIVYDIAISYVRSIIGIAVIICLSKKMKTNKYIAFVGTNTLTYFALHGKLEALTEAILNKFPVYILWCNNVFFSSILAIVITFVLSLCLIIPAEIINRWFPWVLGRKRKPKKSRA